jgi:hypothetical protein
VTTSSVWTYSVTASDIITSALEDIEVIANGQTADANDVTTSLRTLNLLVKQWQGTSDKFPGLKVWTRQRVAMPFVLNQSRYLIGPASSDDRAAVMVGSSATASFVATQLSAAKAANATSVTVSSTTGMTAADQIGFINATTGVLGWTTISSVDSATGLTLPANSVAAALSGSIVYTYTSKAQRFVEVESVVLRDWSSPSQPIDMGLELYTDVQQFEAITQKQAPGDCTAVLVEPQRLNTAITLNFAAANLYKTLRMTVIYPAEDYTTTANDIAYPQEYFAALEWELARRLAPKFGKPWSSDMQNHWTIAVTEGVNINPDNTSLSYEPNRESDIGTPFSS